MYQGKPRKTCGDPDPACLPFPQQVGGCNPPVPHLEDIKAKTTGICMEKSVALRAWGWGDVGGGVAQLFNYARTLVQASETKKKAGIAKLGCIPSAEDPWKQVLAQ